MKIPFYPKHIAALAVAASVAFAFTGCESPSSQSASSSSRSQVSFQPVPVRETNFSGDYFPLKELDVQPRVRGIRAEPMYPFELKKAGVSGEAIITFIVNTNGDIEQAQVQRATHKGFGDAALAAVKKWKFRPGEKGGVPVNCLMQIPLAFNLNTNR